MCSTTIPNTYISSHWMKCMNARAWMKVAASTCISTLKLNFSPVRGSILMQFRTAWIHSTDHCGLDRENRQNSLYWPLNSRQNQLRNMNESGRYYMYILHVKTKFLARPWFNSRPASWPYHAVAATISKLKLNFSPVRGSILMRFRSIEPPEFILLAIAFSSKSEI